MQDVIDLFIEICQIDSPSGNEGPMGRFILRFLRELGLQPKKDSYGNIYTKLEGEGEPLFFSAHMDTVEPGRGVKPIIKDKYIISDGTTVLGADDKVAVAGILHVIRKLKKTKHRPLDLVFTVCEETDTSGSLHFDEKWLLAKKGYCFDSSNPVGTIITASPFYERFDVTIRGQAAHASKPEEGNNVLFVLGNLFHEMMIGRINGDTTVNIGVVKAGDVRNTVPGIAEIHGEVRSFIEKKLLNEKAKIMTILTKVSDKYHVAVGQEWVRENPGYKHEDSQGLEFIHETKEVIRKSGFTPQTIQAGGVSDANLFNTKGLLCINLGDGTEFTHTRQERVKISELENLVKLMVAIATQ